MMLPTWALFSSRTDEGRHRRSSLELAGPVHLHASASSPAVLDPHPAQPAAVQVAVGAALAGEPLVLSDEDAEGELDHAVPDSAPEPGPADDINSPYAVTPDAELATAAAVQAGEPTVLSDEDAEGELDHAVPDSAPAHAFVAQVQTAESALFPSASHVHDERTFVPRESAADGDVKREPSDSPNLDLTPAHVMAIDTPPIVSNHKPNTSRKRKKDAEPDATPPSRTQGRRPVACISPRDDNASTGLSQEWEVDGILSHASVQGEWGPQVLFQVKWAAADETTWEWEAELQLDAPELVKAYWDAHGGRRAFQEQKRRKGEGELFEILGIRTHQRCPRRGYVVEVEWLGYPGENTTEPVGNLQGNPGIMQKYISACLWQAGLHEGGVETLEDLDRRLAGAGLGVTPC
ncbi:hypothetical protein QBC39DRAFT_364452 [Podospora conica]|nr:hypothetical protein QBC39DRAFT_364452 [Schizothecium conicum]